MSKKVLTFHYTLTDTKGTKLDASEQGEPLAFLTGIGQIIPGLETELMKMLVGQKKRIPVASKDAYGERDDSLIHKVPRDRMPPGALKVGDMLHTDSPDMSVVAILAVTDTEVTVDGNHPLAGQDLIFDVEIVSIREATAEELAHGHAHGAGGHHH